MFNDQANISHENVGSFIYFYLIEIVLCHQYVEILLSAGYFLLHVKQKTDTPIHIQTHKNVYFFFIDKTPLYLLRTV